MPEDGHLASGAPAEFDSFAESYEDAHARNIKLTGESSEYFAAYKASYIRGLMCDASRILDYGCGIGLLARELKRCMHDVQIDGFDPSQESLNRIDPEILSQGVFASDLMTLRGTYDVIVLANVLHHVMPAERTDVIRQAVARLRPCGHLVIFEHNPVNPLTRWAVERCPFDENAILLPQREAIQHIMDGGLRAFRRDYIVFFPRWLSWLRAFESALRWCPIGAQYAVVGSKRGGGSRYTC